MGFPVATRVTDELIDAAIWNADVVANLNDSVVHLIARRTADQSVTSSTVLVDDNTLILPVLANEVWKAHWQFRIAGPSTGDFKFGFTFPTAGELGVHFAYQNASAAIDVEQQGYTTSPTTAWTLNLFVGGIDSLTVDTLYVGGANAGNVKLQFAQATSNATPTMMKTNSTLWGVQLA
jgi:hypothetical protein